MMQRIATNCEVLYPSDFVACLSTLEDDVVKDCRLILSSATQAAQVAVLPHRKGQEGAAAGMESKQVDSRYDQEC